MSLVYIGQYVFSTRVSAELVLGVFKQPANYINAIQNSCHIKR